MPREIKKAVLSHAWDGRVNCLGNFHVQEGSWTKEVCATSTGAFVFSLKTITKNTEMTGSRTLKRAEGLTHSSSDTSFPDLLVLIIAEKV